jgi:hypothetical protein
MTRSLGAILLVAGLCCAPAARAQSPIDSTFTRTDASSSSAAFSVLSSAPTINSAPDTGSASAAISSVSPISLTSSTASFAAAISPAAVIGTTPPVEVGPVRGGHELELWVSQSHSLEFMSKGVNDNLFQVGGRYGWILTKPIGPGALRGEFEYAVNFIPLIIPFQPNGPTYGFGLDPFTLKWNFQRRGNMIPYAEASAGGMAVLKRVPPNGSYWDFTASGGFGVQILRGRYVWSVDCRFYHVSDAGIIANDPSLNTIEIRLGFGLFRHSKS